MKRSLSVGLVCLLVIISPLPWLLFYRGAYYEPFYVFRAWDAICQLGIASALIVVLLEISGLVIFGIATQRLSGWWSVALLWLTILILLSIASASDWLSDMSGSPVWGGAGAQPCAGSGPGPPRYGRVKSDLGGPDR